MDKPHIKAAVVCGTAFFFLFIISLISFVIIEGETVKRTFFFPHDIYGTLNSEIRKLPYKDTPEENIALYIKEILLGPATYINASLVPESTRIRTILYRHDTVYVDFGEEILFTEDIPVSFEKSIKTLVKSVYFNFPSVENVIVTVNGQQIREAVHNG